MVKSGYLGLSSCSLEKELMALEMEDSEDGNGLGNERSLVAWRAEAEVLQARRFDSL